MLTTEQNDLLTHTNRGTPAGELFRRFWQPVALAEELPPGAPPRPVRVMGEDLVLFRDAGDVIGLMALRCPHRGADLSYGRVEGDGLRCLYHGWLINRKGRCLDMPGEFVETSYKERIRHRAYPCREAAGLILAYMGPLDANDEPPPLPDLAIFSAPPEHVWASKLIQECNYLQGNEGNVDPQHLSFLHRMASPNQAPNDPTKAVDAMLAADVAPRLDVEETAFGLRVYASRNVGPGEKYIRVSNFIMPNFSAFEGGPLQDPAKVPFRPNAGYQMHWHVPIDDHNHWKYVLLYCYDAPVDGDFQNRAVRGEAENYESARRRDNRYMQNRSEMDRLTFLGMGYNFQDHDRFATESQGSISDRTTENLGSSDRGVIAMRRQMLRAIEAMARNEQVPMMRPEDGAEVVVVSQKVPLDFDPLRLCHDFRPKAAARTVQAAE